MGERPELLEFVLESTSDMIWANACESMGLIAFNSALARYFADNFGVELRLGMAPEDMLPPEAAKRWRDFHSRAVREGPFTLEYEVLAGTHVLDLSFNHITKDGRCLGISVFGKDITARKRAERELRISEDKYKRAFRCSADVVLISSLPDGCILEINDRATEILGYSREQLVGHTTVELALWKDPAQRKGFLDPLLRDGFIHNYEAQFRKRSGELIDIIGTGELVELPSGVCTLGTIRDVTNLRRTARALEATQAAYRRLVDDAPIGIYCRHADPDAGYVFANPTTLQQFECKSLEDLNARFGRVAQRWLHPERYDEFAAKLRRDGQVIGAEVEVPVADGRVKSFTLYAFLGVDNLVGGFSVDMTSQRAAERQRVRLEERIAHHQKLEALGTLSGGIAHDFNNILGAIVGNLDLALMDVPETSPTHDLLKNMEQATERAVALVRQILAFSRQSPRAPKPIRPCLLVKEVLKLIRAGLPSTVSIVEGLESQAWIMADPNQIHQVLMNLCTNANLAMRQSGGVLDVRVDECEADADLLSDNPELAPGQYLRLSVKDTGCGIPAQHVGRIFEPFFTTRPQGEGTGLGLSVVHGIVSESGGAIRVASEVGRGTTFEIFFPRCEPASVEPQDGARPIKGHGHVLVVDDEVALTDLAREGLERFGHKVTVFNDSSNALAAFLTSPMSFDVVVTDMTMPKLTGDVLPRQSSERVPISLSFWCPVSQTASHPNACRSSPRTAIAKSPFAQRRWHD